MSKINPHIENYLTAHQYELKPLEYYTKGIVEDHNKLVLSEVITLLESHSGDHQKIAYEILAYCYKNRVVSRRIAVTGSPGVGKSTFIEKLGKNLVDSGHNLAVLTIDPSSRSGKGSILGDKTRMPDLSRYPNTYIRSSPSGNHLGGTTESTYEAIILCEAAGMDTILVETVGVGQSEQEVGDFTDASILLLNPSGGDELQGIKKGIVEIADIAVVNKADGDRLDEARKKQKEYSSAFHYSKSRYENWKIPVLLHSSVTTEGGDEIISILNDLFTTALDRKKRNQLRNRQTQEWYLKKICQTASAEVIQQIVVHGEISRVRTEISHNRMSPFEAFLSIHNKMKIRISLE